jgi:proteasome lid subunit RPN8/RPN11
VITAPLKQIRVSDVSGQNQVLVDEVPSDTTIGEFLDELVPRMKLPRKDSGGHPLTYHARLEREGRHLNRSERVSESLLESDRLTLQPNIDAGGAGGPRGQTLEGEPRRRSSEEGRRRAAGKFLPTTTRMQTPRYQFAIEMLTHDGATSLGLYPVEVDWEPALEHLRLAALRRGIGNGAPGGENASIDPVWSRETGEPQMVGARLSDGEFVSEVALAYFKPLAVEISGELVEKKLLKSGELFLFRLYAFRRATEQRARSKGGFTVRDATPRIPFVDSPLAALLEKSAPSGDAETGEVPVFIPQHVLNEVEAITLEAGPLETGGILIGHIHRDASIPDIALLVTAQIPAPHTQSKTTALTFTAETWTAVQAALDLRKSGEMMVGWWHSHPSFAFCNSECSAERRKVCALQKPFLSNDDVVLHRTVFPKGYHVALLANNADAGLEFALFGWSGGTVLRRAFRILGCHPRPPRARH